MQTAFGRSLAAACVLVLTVGCASKPPDGAKLLPPPARLVSDATVSLPLPLSLPALPALAVLPVVPIDTTAVPMAPDIPPIVTDASNDKYRLSIEVPPEVERGGASWYGSRFHGKRTASGERYNKYALTAAHRTLPFGTIVRVRSVVTGREINVRINDRGPFEPGRVIDVSHAAAVELGMLGAGAKDVELTLPKDIKLAEDLPLTAKALSTPSVKAKRTASRKPVHKRRPTVKRH